MESSSSTDPSRVRVGRLGRPHGLEGFLGFYLEPDHLDRVQPGATVTVAGEELKVRALRRVDKGYQVAFEGFADRSRAEAIRGEDVFVSGGFALGDDEFWPGQLEGLVVVDETGARIGVVSHVVLGAAQDRLAVKAVDGTLFEVPFVEALVPLVDLERGMVEVVNIPGLTGT